MIWQLVEEDIDENGNVLRVERVGVPGGWLVRSVVKNNFSGIISSSVTFLPDPGFKWRV